MGWRDIEKPEPPFKPAALDGPSPHLSDAMHALIRRDYDAAIEEYERQLGLWAEQEASKRAQDEANTYRGGEALRRRRRAR